MYWLCKHYERCRMLPRTITGSSMFAHTLLDGVLLATGKCFVTVADRTTVQPLQRRREVVRRLRVEQLLRQQQLSLIAKPV